MPRINRNGTVAAVMIACVGCVRGVDAFVLAEIVQSGAQANAAKVVPAKEVIAKDILKDLSQIASPGIPGTLAVWGERAQVLVACADKGQPQVPIVAVAEFATVDMPAGAANASRESGRVALFTHSGYADPKVLDDRDTGTLMIRLVVWAANKEVDSASEDKPLAGIHVAVANAQLRPWLESRGATVTIGRDSTTAKEADVAILGDARNDATAAAWGQWANSGKGLIIAQTGWGWKQLNNDAPMHTNPWNKLLSPAGIAWTSEYADDTAADGFAVGPVDSLAHGSRALAWLEAEAQGDHAANNVDVKLLKVERAQASQAATDMARSAQDETTIARLDALEASRGGPVVPSEKSPIKRAQGLDRVLVAHAIAKTSRVKPEEIKAHPSSATFPGAVPNDAQRVSRDIAIDTKANGWKSTGLYAAPGELIEVTIAAASPTQYQPKQETLKVRIGCHTDQLWHKPEWVRMPEITITVPIVGELTRLASAFGGLIYIEVDGRDTGTYTATIKGAVEAPRFVRSTTDINQWRAHIRYAPGPWAELETDKVIVSVPSTLVRELDDPEELLKVWDQVLDAAADLATISRERARPERYVADVDISVGYMHSGYPIMTHLDAAAYMASADALRAGTWGLFHELGHNHQESDWTFDGTVEVTCNLFSLYLMEQVANKPVGGGHDALEHRARSIGKHLALGAPFERWQSEPFVALEMYIQMREAFGWETYKKVFAEYRALPREQRPSTELEKRDQWMVRMSKVSGKNLGPFFQAWGVPTSEAARASIASLPTWMPEGFPPK